MEKRLKTLLGPPVNFPKSSTTWVELVPKVDHSGSLLDLQ